jgi:hypothetical protein
VEPPTLMWVRLVINKMEDMKIKKAELLDVYHTRARTKENLKPYYVKYVFYLK